MILGPRTLLINGKAHKVLSFLEDTEGVEVTIRPMDSHVVNSVRLSLREWRREQQKNASPSSPISIIRK